MCMCVCGGGAGAGYGVGMLVVAVMLFLLLLSTVDKIKLCICVILKKNSCSFRDIQRDLLQEEATDRSHFTPSLVPASIVTEHVSK